jgi:hypothetical protein
MGQLIEFYRPTPKPPITEVEVASSNEEIIRKMLTDLAGRADTIEDVLVVMLDKDDNIGTMGTTEDLAHTVLLLHKALANMIDRSESELRPIS